MQKSVVDVSKIPRELLEKAYREIERNKKSKRGE